MSVDLPAIAAIALGFAVETRGHADSDTMNALMDDLPDECDAFLFVCLVRTYQGLIEVYGPEAIERAALMWAQRRCGLVP